MAAYRRDRLPEVLRRHTVYAIGATLLLVLAAYAGRRLVRLLRSAFERRYQTRIKGIQDRSLNLVKVEQIWRALTGLLNFAWASRLS
jgi:hypothetical protein